MSTISRYLKSFLNLSVCLIGIGLFHSAYGNDTSADDSALNKNTDIKHKIQAIFPSATIIADKQKDFPVIPVYQLQELLGYVFVSNDLVDLPGFSGNRINMMIGLNVNGELVGSSVLNHHEPIFLHGLGPKPLNDFVKQYIGHNISQRIIVDKRKKLDDNTTYIDGVTKATVSIIVIHDTILSSSLIVARKYLSGFTQNIPVIVKPDFYKAMSWDEMLRKGYVKEWLIDRKQVEKQFGEPLSMFENNEISEDGKTIRIFYAYLNSPMIGRNLLGSTHFDELFNSVSTSAGEHVILMMSSGFYSYIDAAFKPGSVPERVGIEQSGLPIPMRDINFFDEMAYVLSDGVPKFSNARLFKIKRQTGFNPSVEFKPFLNIVLSKNHLVTKTISISDEYQLPSNIFEKTTVTEVKRAPLWLTIWKSRMVEVIVLCASLLLLLFIFILQNKFIQSDKLFARIRWGFLFFTLMFIGFYSQGQLSVVNLFPVLLSIRDGFKLNVFLLDPILFILWSFTFISLFLWGRGLFCGWLCPFGALQEMVSWIAKKFSIKQLKVNYAWHRKLQSIKYLILIVLVIMAFYSLTLAEQMSEVEPFKTVVTLSFVRYWPFVVYALLLLGAGLFIHKFYCRYLCPLGAALAILGKFHLFKWLVRREECGKPCQLCRHRCEIDAINKQGEVDYNECIQCLECVVIINDKSQCVPEIIISKQKNKGINIPIEIK